jgi:hypothetical protein
MILATLAVRATNDLLSKTSAIQPEPSLCRNGDYGDRDEQQEQRVLHESLSTLRPPETVSPSTQIESDREDSALDPNHFDLLLYIRPL